jgi:hypothetical protein
MSKVPIESPHLTPQGMRARLRKMQQRCLLRKLSRKGGPSARSGSHSMSPPQAPSGCTMIAWLMTNLLHQGMSMHAVWICILPTAPSLATDAPTTQSCPSHARRPWTKRPKVMTLCVLRTLDIDGYGAGAESSRRKRSCSTLMRLRTHGSMTGSRC